MDRPRKRRDGFINNMNTTNQKPVFQCHWNNRVFIDVNKKEYVAQVYGDGEVFEMGSCNLMTTQAQRLAWVDQIWMTMMNCTPGIDMNRVVVPGPYAHLPYHPWDEGKEKPGEAV